MRIPKRIVQLPRNANLHRDDVLAIVDQNNRTSKISLLQLAEFLSGTSQTLAAGNDYVTQGEYNDESKEIILSRNDGAQIKITGFTGGQDVYTNETPVPEKVGGVEEGTTFLNKTMEAVFNMLFYPTLEPESIPHSTNLVLNYTGVREIGESLDLEFTNSAGGGSWTQDWQGTNLQPVNFAGEALSAKIEYTGDGSFSNINSLQITGKYGLEDVGYNNYEVVEGNQSWELKTTFAPGEEPINSDGVVSQVVSKFNGGDLTSSKTINGTYPIYIKQEEGSFSKVLPLVSLNTSTLTLQMTYSEINPGTPRFEFHIPQKFGTPTSVIQIVPGLPPSAELLSGAFKAIELTSINRSTTYHNNVAYHKFLHNAPGKQGVSKFIVKI